MAISKEEQELIIKIDNATKNVEDKEFDLEEARAELDDLVGQLETLRQGE